jgi:Tfp pilus assembly protein PilO
MKRLIYYVVLVILFGGGMLGYYRVVYPKIPGEIEKLNKQIQAKNEKLISAQILASQLDLVARLIDRNLAISAQDSLAQDASLPFLEYITTLLNERKVLLVSLEPAKKRITRHDYVRTSYSMLIECSYKEFGQFINELEKSDRIVTVESFEVKNMISQIEQMKNRRGPDQHLFELKISTLTLIKHT